jgi:hypothetical protein
MKDIHKQMWTTLLTDIFYVILGFGVTTVLVSNGVSAILAITTACIIGFIVGILVESFYT